jgi:uncharacterized surface protein with fasciclin (FAS1) repeats
MTRLLRASRIAAPLLAASFSLLGCDSDDDASQSSSTGVGGSAGAPTVTGNGGTSNSSQLKDIVATATSVGTFTKLTGALEAASLTTALKAPGPFTVFAPTDDAFAAFEVANPGTLASLSKDQLTAVLTYHVLDSKVLSTALVSGALVKTLNGARVAVDLSKGATIGGANVTTADVPASNGVIHVIDKILLPPSKTIVETAVAAGTFTKLAGALVATGLDKTLSGTDAYTVFAPTDAAFADFEAKNPGVLASLSTAALTDVLLYHVVPGWAGPSDLTDGASVPTALSGKSLRVDKKSGVKINAASVTATNIVAKNGVIHVIDAVLLPPNG